VFSSAGMGDSTDRKIYTGGRNFKYADDYLKAEAKASAYYEKIHMTKLGFICWTKMFLLVKLKIKK
jgi:hypothetical protein